MSKKPKGYEQKFHVGHFTKGTHVMIDTGMSSGHFSAYVEDICANNPNSWVIFLDRPNPSREGEFANSDGGNRCFNICHVKKIWNRAEGRVTYHKYDDPVAPWAGHYRDMVAQVQKPKGCYVASGAGNLVAMLLTWHPDFNNVHDREYLLDIDALVADFDRQLPGKRTHQCPWVEFFDKKRSVKLLRKLMAKHKMSRHQAQRKHDAYMNDCFGVDNELQHS